MRMTQHQLNLLETVDSGVTECYKRFLSYEKKLNELRESRDVANDYVDDTLSFDQVIQNIATSRDEAAYRLNWALKNAGLALRFDYVG